VARKTDEGVHTGGTGEGTSSSKATGIGAKTWTILCKPLVGTLKHAYFWKERDGREQAKRDGFPQLVHSERDSVIPFSARTGGGVSEAGKAEGSTSQAGVSGIATTKKYGVSREYEATRKYLEAKAMETTSWMFTARQDSEFLERVRRKAREWEDKE